MNKPRYRLKKITEMGKVRWFVDILKAPNHSKYKLPYDAPAEYFSIAGPFNNDYEAKYWLRMQEPRYNKEEYFPV